MYIHVYIYIYIYIYPHLPAPLLGAPPLLQPVIEELVELGVGLHLLHLNGDFLLVVLEAPLEDLGHGHVHVALALVLEAHRREDASVLVDQRRHDAVRHLQEALRVLRVLDREEDELGEGLLGPDLRVALLVVGVAARLHVPGDAELRHHRGELVRQLRAVELAEAEDDRRARLLLQGVVLYLCIVVCCISSLCCCCCLLVCCISD